MTSLKRTAKNFVRRKHRKIAHLMLAIAILATLSTLINSIFFLFDTVGEQELSAIINGVIVLLTTWFLYFDFRFFHQRYHPAKSSEEQENGQVDASKYNSKLADFSAVAVTITVGVLFVISRVLNR